MDCVNQHSMCFQCLCTQFCSFPGLNSQVQVPGSRCPDISAIAQGNFLVSWQHDKTTRPWTAAQKMVVRKQLCMNTLISLLLFSIATQLVRFIAGRLSLAQVGHWCLFGTSEDALDINPTFVYSSSVSHCLQGDVQAGCFSPLSCCFFMDVSLSNHQVQVPVQVSASIS